MIAATKKGRPALEPVIPDLMKAVPCNYMDGGIRRATGRIAKEIMERKEYEVLIETTKESR